MSQPTTGDEALDTVVTALTQVVTHAHKHVDRRMLLLRLRATPLPTEPIARTLYKMLNTLAVNLPSNTSTRSDEDAKPIGQTDTSPRDQSDIS